VNHETVELNISDNVESKSSFVSGAGYSHYKKGELSKMMELCLQTKENRGSNSLTQQEPRDSRGRIELVRENALLLSTLKNDVEA
jgi:hypothetical protein